PFLPPPPFPPPPLHASVKTATDRAPMKQSLRGTDALVVLAVPSVESGAFIIHSTVRTLQSSTQRMRLSKNANHSRWCPTCFGEIVVEGSLSRLAIGGKRIQSLAALSKSKSRVTTDSEVTFS